MTSVVGPGRARVQLTADFDFNRVTQTSEQVRSGRPRACARARRARNRSAAAPTARKARSPSATSCRAASAAARAAKPAAAREQSRKTEEIVNYEISRSTKTEVTEGGRVNRISVAVLVDGIYTRNDKGEAAYQPRDKEELDRIAALVRSAIGFDQKRGDQVEVVNLRFAEAPRTPIAEPTGWLSFLQFTKDDIMHWVELAGDAAARPDRAADSWCGRWCAASSRPRARARPHEPRSPPPSRAATCRARSPPAPPPRRSRRVPNQTAKMIDIAQVQGQVHAQSVQKVGELADKNPHETVSIIRTWLHEQRSLIDIAMAASRNQRPDKPQRDIASVVATLASRQAEQRSRRAS